MQGDIYQRVDASRGTIDNIVTLRFLKPPLLPDEQQPALRAYLRHSYSVTGSNVIRIVYESTSVEPLLGKCALGLYLYSSISNHWCGQSCSFNGTLLSCMPGNLEVPMLHIYDVRASLCTQSQSPVAMRFKLFTRALQRSPCLESALGAHLCIQGSAIKNGRPDVGLVSVDRLILVCKPMVDGSLYVKTPGRWLK
jgi:hypothetical protein